jgi:hypothetical protein
MTNVLGAKTQRNLEASRQGITWAFGPSIGMKVPRTCHAQPFAALPSTLLRDAEQSRGVRDGERSRTVESELCEASAFPSPQKEILRRSRSGPPQNGKGCR